MYIEDRLFSENTEETLYSILLDEDEYALYSEFQKEFGLAQKVGEAVKKNVGKLKEKVSKIGNRLKNKELTTEVEEVKKVKPKKVKRINKELKNKKIFEDAYGIAREDAEMLHPRAAIQAARGVARQNPLELSKADFAVIKNQAEKSHRFKNGLYMKSSDPVMEKFRQQHLKELKEGGVFNPKFGKKITFRDQFDRVNNMDVTERKSYWVRRFLE